MYAIRDASLAPLGRQRIQWVREFMPVLSGIRADFEKEQPFQGLRIAVSVHIFVTNFSPFLHNVKN